MIRYQRLLKAVYFFLPVVLLGSLLQGSYYFTLLNLIGLNVIIVLGLNLLMGYAGQISLGHAAFFGLGAYPRRLTATFKADPLLALLAALVVSTLVAVVCGHSRPQAQRLLFGHGNAWFRDHCRHNFQQLDWLTGGPSGLMGIPHFRLAG